MEELVKRARFILNILLFSSLILSWAAYNEPVDITKNILKLYDKSIKNTFANSKEYMYTCNFVEQVKKGKIDRIPISVILNIRKDSISTSKYLKLRDEVLDSIYKLNYYKLKSIQSLGAEMTKEDMSKYIELNEILAYPPSPPPLPFQESPLIIELIEELEKIENLFKTTNLDNTVRISQINKKLKTTIELPLLKEPIETDKAIVLISLFIIAPLLLFLSIAKTISKVTSKSNEGISWIFFHSGKLGVILGVIQLSIPFFSILYTIILGRLKLVYALPLVVIVFFLSFLCIKETLKARKSFIKNYI